MNVNENILNSLFNEFCKEKNKITNLKDVLIDEEYIDFYELEDELDKLEKKFKVNVRGISTSYSKSKKYINTY